MVAPETQMKRAAGVAARREGVQGGGSARLRRGGREREVW